MLQPGAAVGVHGGGVQLLAGLVVAGAEVNAGATNQLADDDTLRTVVDEGTRVGHEREIAHEDLLLLYLAGLLVQQPGGNAQGRRVGSVAFLALFDGVFGLSQMIIHEFQSQIAGEVLNGGNVAENLFQTLVQKPAVRVLLHLDEVGHGDNLIDAGKVHAFGFARVMGLTFIIKSFHSYPVSTYMIEHAPPGR